MDNEQIENNCGLCFHSEKAKGVAEYIYCTKHKEYRKPSKAVCDDYLYDIIKRPVRRRAPVNFNKNYNFEI